MSEYRASVDEVVNNAGYFPWETAVGFARRQNPVPNRVLRVGHSR